MTTDELTRDDLIAVAAQLRRELLRSRTAQPTDDRLGAKYKELGLLRARVQERVLEMETQRKDEQDQGRSN